MNTTKQTHTRGPWVADWSTNSLWDRKHAKGWSVRVDGDEGYGVLCTVSDDIPERMANARIIAAAPELLTELEFAHRIIQNALNIMTPSERNKWANRNAADRVDGEGITRANEREAVIAKAKGE